ncbi:MAG: dihydroorotate dehydrogenase (quinone), partial [Pseudomonadota bacterium]
ARAGPGFVELGAVTPRPQPGNPRPRLFRLAGEGGAINRFGFNNAGMEAMAARLEALRAAGPVAVPLGLNLGANKDSEDRAGDYAVLIARLGPLADFLTVNVSSPNTERLRDLQGAAALDAVLARAVEARAGLARPVPLFLKVAPDLAAAEIDTIAAAALHHGLDAVIATNTTLSREGVAGPVAAEPGGLSGRPLMARSTAVLAALHLRLGDRVPLIGVGGIASAEDAYAKIRAWLTVEGNRPPAMPQWLDTRTPGASSAIASKKSLLSSTVPMKRTQSTSCPAIRRAVERAVYASIPRL